MGSLGMAMHCAVVVFVVVLPAWLFQISIRLGVSVNGDALRCCLFLPEKLCIVDCLFTLLENNLKCVVY